MFTMHSIDTDVLRNVQLFAELDDVELEQLGCRLRVRTFKSDHAVFIAGEPGTCVCIIESGRVKLAANSLDGREVILDLLGPGEVFGEMAVLDGQARSVDAVAVEPTRLLLLDRADFVSFLERHPRMTLDLLNVLTQRLRRDADLIQDATFLDVPARLARTILRIAEPTAHGTLVTPRMRQRVLAGLAGTTRETLNKFLGMFADQGILQWDSGCVTVLRPTDLRKRIY